MKADGAKSGLVTTRLLVVIAALLVTLSGCAATDERPWRGSKEKIEEYLLQRTPIGSSEDRVIKYLNENGMNYAKPWRGDVDPEIGYPPNKVRGSSFIRALVAEHRMIFVTSVEAFYVFDSRKKLVEIAIRRTTDSI